MKLAVVLLLVGIVAVSCIPQRGGGRGGRGGGKGGKGRGPKACRDNDGIDTCECTDGSTCDGEDCKRSCGRKNPPVSCTCQDGEEWTRPEPCKDNDGIESCECKNGETCEDLDGCIETCRKIEKITSCTCNDGEPWTKPEKPSKPGKPCGGKRRAASCTCEDEETYEGEDIWKNCKKDENPAQECECKNGDTWVAKEDSQEDSEEDSQEDSEEE